MSTGSILPPSMSVTLPKCFIPGRCVLVTAIGYGSTSLAHAAFAPHMVAHSGMVPLPSNKLPSFRLSTGRFSSALICASARLTKNSAFGKAIPLPHILYSALSVCRLLCHATSLSTRSRIGFCTRFPLMAQSVAYTLRQKAAASSGISAGSCSISPQPSGNPCSLPHSIGIRRRTM